MSRSNRHACGRACAACRYTPARNKRAANIARTDIPSGVEQYDDECSERGDGYYGCDGCEFCNSDIADYDGWLETGPLTVALAEVAR